MGVIPSDLAPDDFDRDIRQSGTAMAFLIFDLVRVDPGDFANQIELVPEQAGDVGLPQAGFQAEPSHVGEVAPAIRP
ncbi:hypothetical protein [Methylococcus geothermalis]|uniref:hypothetical protein n=1 Tax=Methylococcus geothermalis TaxID=2681310 RepID=UPI00146E104F|nr:hypothetical protein [Methylococcus geothermalis]